MPSISTRSSLTTRSPLTLGMLSTWPPTRCGLATFASALTSTLRSQGHRVDVVPVDAQDGHAPEGRLVLRPGDSSSARDAAAALSQTDVTIIQHEYGIYGGRDGQEVLDVLDHIRVPSMVVLHTVLAAPSPNERLILERLCSRAECVVVMSASARERLLYGYSVDSSRIITIPHGARVPALHDAAASASFLSWGLVGPGKGLEHAITAVGLLDQLGVPVRYTIAGSMHPKVLARYGPGYRDGLVAQAQALNVEHLVTFDERYRDVEELTRFITEFDTVILPYDTTEQVTSGVLIDSLAAGRAVISTRFPHAVELLRDGAGLLVDHRNPRALAVAMHTVVSEPGALACMQASARSMAPELSWETVSRRYSQAARTLAWAGARA